MCSRYYLEPSSELLPIIERTRRCRLTENMIIHLGRPLKKDGIISPDDIVPVIAPDQCGNRKEFPMVWGFHIEGLEKPVINARVENAKDTDIEGRLQYNVYYLSSSTNSNYASEIVYKQLEEMNKKKSKKILLDENLDAEYVLNPIVKTTVKEPIITGSFATKSSKFLYVLSLIWFIIFFVVPTKCVICASDNSFAYVINHKIASGLLFF